MKRLFLCMERELVVVKERYGNYEAAYHLQNMQPTCIAVDPFQKNRVYCGTFGRGLWLSDDSGDSWRPIEILIVTLIFQKKMVFYILRSLPLR